MEVNESFEIGGLYYTEGTKYRLSIHTLNELLEANKIEYIDPLFKPQEGEGFIKDLEEAVRECVGKEATVRLTGDYPAYFRFDINGARLEILRENLVVHMPDGEIFFDTAAYVDKLRELGYYI